MKIKRQKFKDRLRSFAKSEGAQFTWRNGERGQAKGVKSAVDF